METKSSNIFIINRSEIEGQLNPSLYKERFYFKSNIFSIKKISEIAFINPNTSFSSLKDNDVISFVPMEAIDEENGIISKKYYKLASETKGFTRFLENDLIWAKITPCMQNGKSAIVRNTLNNYACGSTEFFIIRPKNDSVLVEYLHFILRDERVLNIAQNYFGGSAGQQRVSKDFLLNYKIPLPPKEIQQIIVDNINQAYQLKQEKEKEAKRLLDSIDDYLLGELGITLPEIDNSLENRVFISSFSEVTGDRLDSKFVKSKILEDALLNSKWETSKLKDLILSIKTGTTPNAKYDSFSNEGIYFLRNSNLQNSELDLSDIKFVKAEFSNQLTYSFQNELIICIAGTVGDAAINNIKEPIAINQNITSIQVNENKINVKFLCSYFNTWFSKELVKRVCSVATIYYLNNKNLLNLFIPVPPIEKQKEIAEHISEIREEAKRLQLEAKEILEKAKLEVEQMILGE